jgi:hypothetical protein
VKLCTFVLAFGETSGEVLEAKIATKPAGSTRGKIHSFVPILEELLFPFAHYTKTPLNIAFIMKN